MSKVHKLAEKMAKAYKHIEGDNEGRYYMLDLDSAAYESWMLPVLRQVLDKIGGSGQMLRDEIHTHVLDFAGNEVETERDLENYLRDTEGEIYTSDLVSWLAESDANISYIDDLLSEFGGDFRDGFSLLQAANVEWKRQIAQALFTALKKEAENTHGPYTVRNDNTDERSPAVIESWEAVEYIGKLIEEMEPTDREYAQYSLLDDVGDEVEEYTYLDFDFEEDEE